MTFSIPERSSVKFKHFFQQLDKDLSKLALRSCGEGITTLEDVFLTIGHGSNNGDFTDSFTDESSACHLAIRVETAIGTLIEKKCLICNSL